MTRLLKILAATAVAFAMTAPALAAPLSPVGVWETENGASRFKVELCGDGTQVCAKLVWLRDDARTPDNLRYLNTYVLKGAKRALENKWRGNAQYQGETVRGTLTVLDADSMTINGCKGALCERIDLRRI